MNKNYVYSLKLVLFTTFLVALDQITKYAAMINLKGKNDFNIIKDVLVFHYLDGGNTGAAWGMFSGKIAIFIMFTIIAIVFICIFIKNVYYLIIRTNKSIFRTLNIFLCILMAGAIGNLVDRVVNGYVIDFIYFKLINFPIFNVADCYVTISCILIIVLCLFKIEEEEFSSIISLKFKKSK